MTADAKHGMKKRRMPIYVPLSKTQDMRIDRIQKAPVQAVVVETFYANFMTHFTFRGEGRNIGNKLTWLQRLSDLATGDPNGVLVLALEATATAYGAIMSSQAVLSTRARDLYGTALHLHHGLLQQSGSKKDITIHMVSTSVLLSFFEAMQATTADAYRAHICGAGKLLELTGPGECGRGVLCQLYYHVKTQMLFIELASNHHNAPRISDKTILFHILMYKRLPLFHKLMCCITTLGASGTVMHETKYASVKAQVEQLWTDFVDDHHFTSQDPSTQLGLFPDAFTALTVAFFTSARILLAVRGSDIIDFESSGQHCQLILHAATYLDTDHNAFAFMRMAMPLLLVALHSQQQAFRTDATGRFAVWSGRSMRGISALALGAISRKEQMNGRYVES
ncbi:hypothetical protein B5807_00157 [Epicoccum nigrum]|uniref:Transcription factor domain-containing protein n=1 Tax=Epicoccum nigrum TaxID=105696 RepID=A0A1Y2ME82_EPING|nr:hypothetical protein B5807_00157 [Epicoccum nigrum]